GSYLIFLIIGLGLISCEKNHNAYYNFQNEDRVFSGSTMNYFSSQEGDYDSLLVVLNRISWIKDSLAKGGATVFAVPNQSFRNVIGNLNVLRVSENKSPLYLNTVDSSQLDTLIARYFIPEELPTDSITFIDGRFLNSFKYGY